jgi:excisionase family DNA binding protein
MLKITNPFQIILDEMNGVKSSIKELKSLFLQAPTSQPEETFLTQKEVANLLGVSSVTIWTWEGKGILKSYRIGNLKRFKKSEILASPKLINR